VLCCYQISGLKNLGFILGNCFPQRFESGVDLLTERLVDDFSCGDKFAKKLWITETEGEVVFDCSDFMKLTELRISLSQIFVARVYLEHTKVKHNSSCTLQFMKPLDNFVDLVEGKTIPRDIFRNDNVAFNL